MTAVFNATSNPSTEANPEQKQKLRSACNCCHQAKVKCSGGSPCFRCASKELSCCYGFQNRGGKPKGSKNRKTIARMQQMRLNWLAEQFEQPRKDQCDLDFKFPDSLAFLSNTSLTKEESRMIPPSPSPPESSTIDPINKLPTNEILSDTASSPGNIDPGIIDMGDVIHTAGNNDFSNLAILDTPLSFTDENFFCQHSDGTTPLDQNNPFIDPNIQYSCACIQNQASNVTTLHKLSSHRAEVFERVDLTMKSITSTLNTCTQFFGCTLCKKTYSSVFLTLSAIHLIFQLFELLIVGRNDNMEAVDPQNILCYLGDYEVSKEEEQAIRKVLLKMALSKGSHTLAELRKLVNGHEGLILEVPDSGLSCEGNTLNDAPGGLSNFDREYIIQCITQKEKVLEAFLTCIVT
ncbi:hypothetical protein BGW36DRAFT_458949 [Talaromyces proteolyticus]|uniref:Zn(2)-C6 fungal-type domain-containing protein n=1 Tax=Talaromyces proteolyticus TaxID=1131652 RepID=A0AAD4KXN6_9EURO|nr:uncharacterized protein BGW36DRAFT_458949 [Talaromyces proteolyticus]KAH8702196.1 hypothetical protein BGW36DRAFT_458949 [Talaromyces proteolyticus]